MAFDTHAAGRRGGGAPRRRLRGVFGGGRPRARPQASRTRRRRSSRSVDPAGVASSSPRSASQASSRRSAPELRPAGVRGERGLGEAAVGRRRALERGCGGTGRGEGIHLHHRRRSIHVSPASETRTSKRLRPGSSWRSGVIQTMRASTRPAPRARGGFSGIRPMPPSAIRNQTWSPSGVELGPEPEGSVRFPGGVARGQGSRPATGRGVAAAASSPTRSPSSTAASTP